MFCIKLSQKVFWDTHFLVKKKAAYVFNKSVESIRSNQTDLVAYRFLQARQGKKLAQRNWKISLFQLTVSVALFPYTYIMSLPLMLFSIPYVSIDRGNSKVYSKVEEQTQKYLKEKLTKECISELNSVEYKNLEKIIPVLTKSNVEVDRINKKLSQRIAKQENNRLLNLIYIIYNAATLAPTTEA